jgi:hypothetical protein
VEEGPFTFNGAKFDSSLVGLATLGWRQGRYGVNQLERTILGCS